MMFLKLTVASLSVEVASVIHINEELSPRSGHTIRMEIYPSEHDYIELKTGEIFCNPSYLKVRGKDREGVAALAEFLNATAPSSPR